MEDQEKLAMGVIKFGVALIERMISKATEDTKNMVDEAIAHNDAQGANRLIKSFYEFMTNILPTVIDMYEKLGQDCTFEKEMLVRMKRGLENSKAITHDMGVYTFEEILKQTGVKTNGKG